MYTVDRKESRRDFVASARQSPKHRAYLMRLDLCVTYLIISSFLFWSAL